MRQEVDVTVTGGMIILSNDGCPGCLALDRQKRTAESENRLNNRKDNRIIRKVCDENYPRLCDSCMFVTNRGRYMLQHGQTEDMIDIGQNEIEDIRHNMERASTAADKIRAEWGISL